MSILIVIAGLLAGRVLPMGQYPDITPPVVFISTSYEGADAQTLAKTVAAPIEDQLSGVEGLLYYENFHPFERKCSYYLHVRSRYKSERRDAGDQ